MIQPLDRILQLWRGDIHLRYIYANMDLLEELPRRASRPVPEAFKFPTTLQLEARGHLVFGLASDQQWPR